MTIIVYTDPDPKFKADCEEVKAMIKEMGLEFTETQIIRFVEYQPGWRENRDERLEVTAAYNFFNHAVPLLRVDGVWMQRHGIEKMLRNKEIDTNSLSRTG